ncbi:MAG: hypothetical protein ACTSU2_09570, partial [Promethearchaeota archaeon]
IKNQGAFPIVLRIIERNNEYSSITLSFQKTIMPFKIEEVDLLELARITEEKHYDFETEKAKKFEKFQFIYRNSDQNPQLSENTKDSKIKDDNKKSNKKGDQDTAHNDKSQISGSESTPQIIDKIKFEMKPHEIKTLKVWIKLLD